jgi:hypothetical protein
MSQSTKTLETLPPSDCGQMELKLTPSAVVSPAKTFRSRAKALASQASDRGSGQNMPVLLASFDLELSLWKTSPRFAIEDSTVFSGKWPRSGMMRNGIAYQLPPLAPLTGGIGSGSLPTPAAVSYGSNQGGGMGRTGPVRHSLDTMARKGLWPTPTSRDWKDGSAQSCNNVPINALLGRAVHQWPTMRSGAGAVNLIKWPARAPKGRIEDAVANVELPQVGGSLNPTWVEWLMGFPLGFTDLGPWATPSSRKSRKSSGAQ